jgi:hypothetical protein
MPIVENKGLAPSFFTELIDRADNIIFPYSRGPSHFSATGVEQGPLERQLALRTNPDKSVFEAIASLDGTMLHYGMEQAAKGTDMLSEVRLYRVIEVDGKKIVISGCNDLQGSRPDYGNFLCDWKRTKAYGVVYAKKEGASGTIQIDGDTHKKSWVHQLNINRWLVESRESYSLDPEVEKNWKTFFEEDIGRPPTQDDYTHEWFEDYKRFNEPFKLDRLVIGAFLKDWDEKKARQSADYPQQNVVFVDQPFMTDAQVESYIHERIQYLDGYDEVSLLDVPLCSEEEQWKKDDVWKVFDTTSTAKNPVSRKNCSSLAEALLAQQVWEQKTSHPHRVEHYPGLYDKCAKYCDYRHECPFGKKHALDNFATE